MTTIDDPTLVRCESTCVSQRGFFSARCDLDVDHDGTHRHGMLEWNDDDAAREAAAE